MDSIVVHGDGDQESSEAIILPKDVSSSSVVTVATVAQHTKPIECAGHLFSDKEFLPFLVLLQHSSVAFYMNVVVLYVGNFCVGPCAVF